jgi:hypothetical protein
VRGKSVPTGEPGPQPSTSRRENCQEGRRCRVRRGPCGSA